ncbi:major facilitator superfamily-domain-containing protein [Aspergillus avenaceus]|uniref:Major facilitator superfamily-domain-containing protein n=1 Tax=Aspergillus avenaceus TaxID=36643 RepID=A0A5N6TDP9_ASPAV|nr:major facilitator superfamily-domain-containing protein [Aspergillus avenaceus]
MYFAEAHSGPVPWITIAALGLSNYLVSLDLTMLSTAMPCIAPSLASIPLYMSASQLACAIVHLVASKLYLLFRVKWTFMSFLMVVCLGALVGALSNSTTMLVLGRVVMGVGMAGVQCGCGVMVSRVVPGERQGLVQRIMMGAVQAGLVSGCVFGGLFTQFVSWRWCFWIDLPVALMVLVLVVVSGEIADGEGWFGFRELWASVDVVGLVLFAGGVVMLLLGLYFGGVVYPWENARVIGCFCGAGVVLLVWGLWNWKKGDEGVVPGSVVRVRKVWTACLTGALVFGSWVLGVWFLSVYFQGVQGMSPLESGVMLLPNILAQVFFSWVAGWLIKHIGFGLVGCLGAVFIATGSGSISTYEPDTGAGWKIGMQILLGLGYGFALQIPMIAIQATVYPHDIPAATSLLTSCQHLAAALFVSCGNTIMMNSLALLILEEIPSVDPKETINAGVKELRSVIPETALEDVLEAFSESMYRVYWFSAACGGLAVICSFGMEWFKLRMRNSAVAARNVS